MDCTIDILNESYRAEEQLIIVEYSGAWEDLTGEVRSLLMEDGTSADDLTAGDWITVVDGEVIMTGEFHPFAVRCSDD